MPSMTRETKRGQATGSSTRTARSARLVTGDAAAGGGTSGAPVTAATSRAMPSTDRQSARFGVILSVISASSSCEHVAHVGAHGRVVGQREQARGIGVDAELARRSTACPAIRRRASSRRRCEARREALRRRSRTGAFMPAAALGAPQTMRKALGRTDVDRAHAQAIGVRMRIDLVDPAHDDAGEGRGGRLGRLDLEPGHRQPFAQARGIERGIDHRAQPAFGEFHGDLANWRRKRRSFSKNRRRSLTP